MPPVGSIPEVSAHRRKLVVSDGLTTCQEAVVSQQCTTILPPLAQPTVPQSPPSPPLAPFADEPCTETTQDERCKVTLKIKARFCALTHAYAHAHTNAHPTGTQKLLTVRHSTSQECSPYKDAMCLTIDKPFYTAFICGQCLNNEHGQADYNSCFEIGGRDMTADAP